MNNKAFTISLALAGMAVFMIYSYISSMEESIKSKYGSPLSVVVAKRDINELSEIHENMIDTVPKPKDFIEPGRTTSKEEVVGFISAVPIRKGEQITLNKIIAPGIRTGLARQVTPGKRAIAIPVTDNTAVSRLIKPGDRIDIVSTIEVPGGGKGSQVTKVVMQDVAILAVGQFISGQSPRKVEKDEVTGKDSVQNLNTNGNFNTITVELEPQAAAQMLLLVESNQRISLMLRNSDDTERVNLPGLTLMDVLGSDAQRIIRTPSGQR